MPEYFDDHRHWPHRALQIWLILIGMALNRQLPTYKEVSLIMGYKGCGVLDETLGHIAYYCLQNGLPALTTLVVNDETGEPGEEIPIAREDICTQRADVYKYEWYKLIPPTPDELAEAWEIGEGQT